ncbi:xanthan lyase [Prolixibacteraceae bacterium JC049]|nr:xanthan lyase [Prolixibacteraceae bacterium JC049]
MLSIHNIRSIAKYESKTLTRSWFFRIFALLSIIFLLMFNIGTLSSVGDEQWILRAMPSSIPYGNLLLLNVAQAIISVFLAADFLKRDKKLDTTETIYMRSMSNAEYVLGKTWGNLKVFIGLNLVILLMVLIFNLTADTHVVWSAYAIYFGLISLPTLIFIMGLSFLLMSLLKNQALTFVLLLGYIAGTIFFLQNKFYFLFDYMTFNIPLFRSDIVGFGNMETILIHRGIYLFLGLSFICFTIYLLQRLPQSRIFNQFSLIFGILFLGIGGSMGYKYVSNILANEEQKANMIELNNEYGEAARLTVDSHYIDLKQRPDGYEATSTIKGVPIKAGKQLVFSLNPKLNVSAVKQQGADVKFERKSHLLLVDTKSNFAVGDTINLEIKYAGGIDEDICYADIDLEKRLEKTGEFVFNIDKRFAFATPEYLLVTPEVYWYPIAGVTYSTKHATWYHKDFIDFKLTVEPLPGLMAVSSGKIDSLDKKIQFTPEHRLPQLALSIGNYDRKAVEIDSMTFSVWHFKGHDYFVNALPEIKDTIPSIIRDRFNDFKRNINLEYPYSEFSLVEVPIQFKSYERIWTSMQETTQPGMVFFPEMGASNRYADLKKRWKRDKKRSRRWRNENLTDAEYQVRTLNNFLGTFTRKEGRNQWKRKKGGDFSVTETANPFYQFPQFYDYCYNLNSDEWPITNRILEAYMKSSNNTGGRGSDWRRDMNGASEDEKANMLLLNNSFAELLTDKDQKQYIDNVINLKGDVLFSLIKAQAGEEAFDEFLKSLLDEFKFNNLTIKIFNERLEQKFNISLTSYMNKWFSEKALPRFITSVPEAVKVKDGDEVRTRVNLRITNDSPTNGVVKLSFRFGGGRNRGGGSIETVDKLVVLAGNQTKELYYMLDNAPRGVQVNTMVSGNLPAVVNHRFGKIEKNKKAIRIESETVIDEKVDLAATNEIIVDNEDKEFSTDGFAEESLLRKWIVSNSNNDDQFKYKGYVPWRAPVNWTLTTNSGFFGKFVRSAHFIKAGTGDKKAIWKMPVKEAGYYDLYYHVHKDQTFRWNRNQKGEYHFTIFTDDGKEEQALEIHNCEDGWSHLGAFYFSPENAKIVLDNNTELRTVIADAVKLVKQD